MWQTTVIINVIRLDKVWQNGDMVDQLLYAIYLYILIDDFNLERFYFCEAKLI